MIKEWVPSILPGGVALSLFLDTILTKREKRIRVVQLGAGVLFLVVAVLRLP